MTHQHRAAEPRPSATPEPSPLSHLSRRALLRRAAATAAALALGGGLVGRSASAVTPGVAGEGRAASRRQTGGTLTVALPFDFPTFDPFQLSFQNFMMIQNQYDTLIRYDKNLTPLPGLAESWELASDGTGVTLKMRRGVKYQSGRELVADDVVKNFEKAADKDRGINMLPAVQSVDSVTAPDASTVVIKMKRISPEITDILQAMAIIDPSGMEGLKQRTAGSGPFRFVEWVPGDRLVTERNPDYWGKNGPYLDRVIYKIFNDSDAMVAALQSGLVDMVANLPPKDIQRLSGDFNLVKGYPGALTYELRINPTRPPFDNKLVRQALQYAIDREGIVATVLFGASEPTVLPFSRYSPAYDTSTLDTYKFDLRKAKDLLDRSGVSTLRASAMVTAQFPELGAIAQVLKDDLNQIGFTLDIEVVDQTEGTRRLLAGDFACTPSFSGNTQKYPTRIALNSIYRTANNPVWGDNVPKAYVDAINAANSTVNKQEQLAAFKRINEALLDESWVISIAYRQSVFALARYVQGFDYTVDDMLVFESTSLAR